MNIKLSDIPTEALIAIIFIVFIINIICTRGILDASIIMLIITNLFVLTQLNVSDTSIVKYTKSLGSSSLPSTDNKSLQDNHSIMDKPSVMNNHGTMDKPSVMDKPSIMNNHGTTDKPSIMNNHGIMDNSGMQPTDIYGPYYDMYHSHTSSYTDCYNPVTLPIYADAAERSFDIDAANVILTQQRARDKRSMDGAVSKGPDYYKYHYGGELKDAENRVWWGRNEY